MTRQNPFFKFDASEWLGGAIQFATLQEKGLFIDLCALYWNSFEPVKVDGKLKVRCRYPEGDLSDLIGTLSDLDLVSVSEAGITIPFLDKLINERKEFLEKCAKGGKKSNISKGTPSKKKEERRKKSVDSRKKIVEKKNVYRAFAHLCLTVPEYEKIIESGYTKQQIDSILDDIENYKDNRKYTSMNLTVRKWLKRVPQQVPQPSVDDLFNHTDPEAPPENWAIEQRKLWDAQQERERMQNGGE